LELVAKGQEIQEKEWLLAEKDRQIAELSQKLQSLEAVEAMEAMEAVEAVEAVPNHPLWLSLSVQNQQELMAAKTASVEAVAQWCHAIERDVVQVFFKKLYPFLKGQSITEIGGLAIKARKKYTLEMLPPLLCCEWRSLHPDHLVQLEKTSVVYSNMTIEGITEGDRQLLQRFLTQWDSPLGQWLLQQPDEAASRIYQIHQLQAAMAKKACPWKFELLQQIILGRDFL
jgi:single-stranded-DNA-specific exonuclease